MDNLKDVVLHLDHTVGRGGAEYALARTLAANTAWSAIVALPRGTTELGPFSVVEGHDRVELAFIGPPQSSGASSARSPLALARYVAMVLRMAVALRRSPEFRRASLVHANTSRAGIYGALACLGSGKPFVVHLRDIVDVDSLGKVGLVAFRRFVLPAASGVIANSHTTLASAQPYISRRALRSVIPSAAGITSRRSSEEPAVAPEVSSVGMLARLAPWKGQDLLLRAFRDVFGGTSTRLSLAGAPEFGSEGYAAELHDVAGRLGIADQVDFLGHVEDVFTWVGRQDICVQASVRPEPLGQNVLQYLSQGRPTIVTSVGGPSEWIRDGHNGVTFEMGDRDSLARALRRLVPRQARAAVASGAAATEGLWSDEDVAQAHATFFTSVAER